MENEQVGPDRPVEKSPLTFGPPLKDDSYRVPDVIGASCNSVGTTAKIVDFDSWFSSGQGNRKK